MGVEAVLQSEQHLGRLAALTAADDVAEVVESFDAGVSCGRFRPPRPRNVGHVRISLGDVALWFDVSGPSVIPQGDTTVERPVLVAVHGGPGLDHITVKSALASLAEDFQVLYFDLRGHGRSDHSSAEFWNLRTWADDLRRLCDALGLRKP